MTRIEKIWYQGGIAFIPLLPFSWLFRSLVAIRRWLYRYHWLQVKRFPVPLIVVGNITVGGTGKTPFVIWLARFLRHAGYKPGVVSRGYRGHATEWPQVVTAMSDPHQVGDEAVVLARRCQCPMVVAPNRVAAVMTLLQNYDCDIVISDDGLQHYAMGRTVEIVIVDGQRRFGNRQLLPAGPLREPVARLDEVDLVVINEGPDFDDEYKMTVTQSYLYNLSDPSKREEHSLFKGKTVHAVAGIGHPEKFFALLNRFGIEVVTHTFADHHEYCDKELDFGDGKAVIMTEKDAVKYARFVDVNVISDYWVLAIEMEPEPEVEKHLRLLLQSDKLIGSADVTNNKRM